MAQAPEANFVVDLRVALSSMPSKDAKAAQWKKRSIYKVPHQITVMNPKAYCPQVVSFGPYHYDEEHLKPMVEHKVRALDHFLKKSGKGVELLERALAEVLDDLMACYDQLDNKWHDNKDAFLRLMVLDGCFMLEILRTSMTTLTADEDYDADDPIFSNHGKLYIMPYVQRDMLMLENQLPMKVLDKLAAVQSSASCSKDLGSVNELILKFFACPDIRMSIKTGRYLHVLDAFRKSRLLEGQSGNSTRRDADLRIRSATELRDAGVQFEKSKSESLNDIKFSGGVLSLPVRVVDDTTESMFLNLMAFERFHVGAGNEVTSYVCFMDYIINTEMDVALLHSKGILWHGIGSDKAVAKLFNSLSKEVSPDPGSSIYNVHEQLDGYCRKYYRRWRASLCHTYFRSPWTAVSLIAAILLFALTILQTVFTVLQLYKA